MKAQRRSRGIDQLFCLALALDRGGWLTSRLSCFTPAKRPGTHCIGGWVGPRVGLDNCGKSRVMSYHVGTVFESVVNSAVNRSQSNMCSNSCTNGRPFDLLQGRTCG
jgi:hypothetical protein